MKNIVEGSKERVSAGFLQTGQATFNLFHINEVQLGFKTFTWQSLNRALIFFTAVNSCYCLIIFFM